MDFFERFSSRIRERREARGIKASDAAESLDISRGYLTNLELRSNQPNVIKIVADMARLYNTTVDYLVGNSNNPQLGEEPSGAAELFFYFDELSDDERETLIRLAKCLYVEALITAAEDDNKALKKAVMFLYQQ